jgi:hypothetical protein
MQVQAGIRSAVTVLLTVVALLVPVIFASAAPGTPVSVKVEPPAQTVIAGSSFSVNLTVGNVTNLGADQATLLFEPTSVAVSSVTEGDFLKSAGTTLGAGLEQIDNTHGSVTFFYALTISGIGVNGSGTLASVLFTTNSAAANATTLVTLSDVLLADGDGVVIPVEEIANATVNIVAPVFDTGRGGYPSISGSHNGTITPSSTLNVSKLYIYPCPGTAGHAEYARLANENESWSIETVPWPGYSGEWHYLNFPQSVILQANETYHYTIRTASYPELIRLPLQAQETTGGTITCSEFVDANGNTRSGWIPAIRLE